MTSAVLAYAEETNRRSQERRSEAEVDRCALEKVKRGIKGIMAVENGMYQAAMKARLGVSERQKAEKSRAKLTYQLGKAAEVSARCLRI